MSLAVADLSDNTYRNAGTSGVWPTGLRYQNSDSRHTVMTVAMIAGPASLAQCLSSFLIRMEPLAGPDAGLATGGATGLGSGRVSAWSCAAGLCGAGPGSVTPAFGTGPAGLVGGSEL